LVIDGSRDPVASRRFDDLLAEADIVVEPVTGSQANVAGAAYGDWSTDHGLRRPGAALVEAYKVVARLHNAAAVTREVDPSARWFRSRSFQVLGAHRFVETCLEQVGDATLRDLPLVGSVDQFADSSDVLSNPDRAQRLRHVYSR